ncbi:MAG TPA: hypothetical protein PL131_04420 [Methylotenera sp.]|nr:hypothetical protein [Methylotenera sp.]HPH05098.1 hypothetical protein [Methylotenera sp.]HPN00462.1 hypothetical protein [Methylotenera sp.]
MVEKVTLTEEAITQLRQGRMIEAIKITRTYSNLGLKDAMQQVDAYLKAHPEIVIQKAQLPQEFRLWLLIIVIGVGILFWLYLNQ